MTGVSHSENPLPTRKNKYNKKSLRRSSCYEVNIISVSKSSDIATRPDLAVENFPLKQYITLVTVYGEEEN